MDKQKKEEIVEKKEKMEKYADPTFDVSFKKIFEDEKLLKSLLESFLHLEDKIQKIQKLPTEHFGSIKPDLKKRKLEQTGSIRYDIYCSLKITTTKNENVIVEIQKSRKEEMFKRALYYWSIAYSENKEGGYDSLVPVVFIVFLCYTEFKENYFLEFELYNKEFKIPIDLMKFVFVQIPAFENKNPEKKLEQWVYLFKFFKEDVPSSFHPDIKKAQKKLLLNMYTDEEKSKYIKQMKELDDRNEEIRTAEKRGMEIGVKGFIKKILDMGKTVEEVAKLCGLTKEEIEEKLKI